MKSEEFLKILDQIEPDENGCKIWNSKISREGYGIANVDGFKNKSAHRISLSIKIGRDLLKGMCACHSCDVRSCVNPDHLWEGTQSENVKDMVNKGRNKGAEKESNYFFGKKFFGASNSFFGKIHKKESLEKMSKKHKASNRTGERNPRFGKGHLYLLGKNPNSRRVIDLDTGEKFDSIKGASIATGIASQNISAVCNGKWKQTKGKRFSFC